MTRYISVFALAVFMLMLGCTSEKEYRAQMKDTQSMIEESALAAYNLCQENQTRAVASSVIAQKMGKPFLTPEAVNRATTKELEESWMQLEVKFGGLSGPPSNCEEEYAAIKRMHEAYEKLYQLATNPAGPVEQYQFATDALYEAIMSKSSDLTEMYADK